MANATQVKDVSADFVGSAILWKLDPPYDNDGAPVEFVISSALESTSSLLGSGHPETLIFAADEDGAVIDWADLASIWETSHSAVLAQFGYAVSS